MTEDHPLTCGREHHFVLADDVAGAHDRVADPALASRSVTVVGEARSVVIEAAALGRRPTEREGRAGRRIDLRAVVRIEDLDVELRRQRTRGGAHELREQRDADAGVGGDEHRHARCGGPRRRLRIGAEAGGADERRDPRPRAGGEVGGGRRGRREVDHDIRGLAAPRAAREGRVDVGADRHTERRKARERAEITALDRWPRTVVRTVDGRDDAQSMRLRDGPRDREPHAPGGADEQDLLRHGPRHRDSASREESLHALEEPLLARRMALAVVAQGLVELAQQLALLRGEVHGRLHDHAAV